MGQGPLKDPLDPPDFHHAARLLGFRGKSDKHQHTVAFLCAVHVHVLIRISIAGQTRFQMNDSLRHKNERGMCEEKQKFLPRCAKVSLVDLEGVWDQML